MRTGEVERITSETNVKLRVDLDGTGVSNIDTGVGFLDHMLTLFSRHGRFDLDVTCKGDTYVDDHHSVEDIGIALGTAFSKALGDCKGIRRYGDIVLPMDEALVLVALDISGRGMLEIDLPLPTEKVGTFDTELVDEFLIGFARNSGITLHVRKITGKNTHHIIEACFKGLGRALRTACSIDEELKDEIPSTKGVLK